MVNKELDTESRPLGNGFIEGDFLQIKKGTKENPIYVDITHFKDMCDLLRWVDKNNIVQSLVNNELIYHCYKDDEVIMTTEDLVIKFIKENCGTDRW
jgi:hypothetical protein